MDDFTLEVQIAGAHLFERPLETHQYQASVRTSHLSSGMTALLPAVWQKEAFHSNPANL